jgi:hypothetical protein
MAPKNKRSEAAKEKPPVVSVSDKVKVLTLSQV